MGSLSIWHWLVLLIFAAILAYVVNCLGKILQRAGYSRLWLLVMFAPLVNIIMIWVFAFASWPALGQPSTQPAAPPR